MSALIRPLQLRYVAGESGRKVTWLELFFDLIFVAAVAQVAEPLREDYTVDGVIRFSVLFVLIWWAWIGNSAFSTRFGSDDALQRALTLLQMFAVAAMAANASDALASRSSAGFAAAYAVVRLVLVAQYARARQLERARGLASRYLTGHGLAAALWLVSAFVPAPERFVVWALAMLIDLGTPWMAVSHSVEVPPDASHLPERFGLFTLILLGESVVAVMHGMKSQEGWSIVPALTAFLGMATAFGIWWWYFDGVSAAAERHVKSRGDAIRFHVWSYAHLPLYLGIAISAAGFERLVHHGIETALHVPDGAILAASIVIVITAMIVVATVQSGDRADMNVECQTSNQNGSRGTALARLASESPMPNDKTTSASRYRNQNTPKSGHEVPGDTNAADIVGRHGEEMPEVAHDEVDDMRPDERLEFEEDIVQGDKQ